MKKLSTLMIVMLVSAGMAFAQSNEATIDQAGNGNQADVEQVGSSNEVILDQFAQGTISGNPTFATADVTQVGADNYVNVKQSAFFQFSIADINMDGDNNRVEGTSENSAWHQSNGGVLLQVDIEGSNNTLYSLRSEAQKNDNSFILNITGDDNQVGGAQEFGTAEIDIDGFSNEMTVFQLANSGGNSAFINVDGSDNTIDVSQTGMGGGTGGSGNLANIDLVNGSNFNTVDVNQLGSGNSTTVHVNGSFNTANVSQSE